LFIFLIEGWSDFLRHRDRIVSIGPLRALSRGGQGGSVNGIDGGVFLEPLATSTTAFSDSAASERRNNLNSE